MLVAAVYLGVTSWSVWLFGWATRTGMVTVRLLAADIAIACVALVVVGLASEPNSATDWTNWSFAYAISVVLTGAAALPLLEALCVSVFLASVYLATVAPNLAGGSASSANAVGNAGSFLGFALFGAAIAHHLRRTGAELDTALARALVAEAEQARYLDRITQYRTLHNTVLATLTGIAGGSWDHRTEAVRARCQRQADYLERLIDGEVIDPSHPLRTALDEIIRQAAEAGLRVHHTASDLPDDLPPEAVRALGIEPDVDLSGPPEDAGIGHSHALLMAQPDGFLALVDLGSINGTYLNGAPNPVEPNVPVPLDEGDRIHLGAWTTLTLHADR